MNIKEKLTPEVGLGILLGVIGIAQSVLSGRKEDMAKEKLKDEIKQDVLKSLSEKQ